MARVRTLQGRDDIVAMIVGLLAAPGALVTLTGFPGVGMTRLALECAARLLQPEAIRIVDGRQTAHLAPALRDLEESWGFFEVAHVSGDADLIVVDDYDRVTEAAQAIEAVRARLPRLRFLLTSTRPQHLPGEVVVRVPALPLPAPDASLSALAVEPAVLLFTEVARATGTTAVLDGEVLRDIARIVALVGGLPRAITCVATRSATYSPAMVIELLEHRPEVVLRADDDEVDHDLFAALERLLSGLTGDQRDLLDRLVVVDGPMPIETVRTLAGSGDVFTDLCALVDLHLVEPLHHRDVSHFMLPALVRHRLAYGTAARPLGTAAFPSSHETLTDREIEVLDLLSAGNSNREISTALGIHVKTVMHHTSNIYRKLAVRGRTGAVAWKLSVHEEVRLVSRAARGPALADARPTASAPLPSPGLARPVVEDEGARRR